MRRGVDRSGDIYGPYDKGVGTRVCVGFRLFELGEQKKTKNETLLYVVKLDETITCL